MGVGEGESTPSPSPSSTTAAPTIVASTTTAPSMPVSTTSTTTGASGGVDSCLRNVDCAANPWCADTTYDAWCAAQTNCPSPQCTRGSGGSHSPASPEPEPEPEPEQIDSPAMTCIA